MNDFSKNSSEVHSLKNKTHFKDLDQGVPESCSDVWNSFAERAEREQRASWKRCKNSFCSVFSSFALQKKPPLAHFYPVNLPMRRSAKNCSCCLMTSSTQFLHFHWNRQLFCLNQKNLEIIWITHVAQFRACPYKPMYPISGNIIRQAIEYHRQMWVCRCFVHRIQSYN